VQRFNETIRRGRGASAAAAPAQNHASAMHAANRNFVILREAAFPFWGRYEMDASLFTLQSRQFATAFQTEYGGL
jgi:hypothetical protein